MSAQPAPTASPGPAPAQDSYDYCRLLHRVLDVGAILLDRIEEQSNPAFTPPPETPRPSLQDLSAAHERVARAIRRTVLLVQKLGQPGVESVRTAARKCIARNVRSVIQRGTSGEQAEALRRELHERLDAPDMDDDISHLTVDEIITEICRDLGLLNPPGVHPWERRTPADIAALCVLAAQPSRPCPASPTSPPRLLPLAGGSPRARSVGKDHPIRAPT